MLEKHPKRKKDKYNPYTLTITEGHYYLSFKDGHGKQQNIEIDEMLYQTLRKEGDVRKLLGAFRISKGNKG